MRVEAHPLQTRPVARPTNEELIVPPKESGDRSIQPQEQLNEKNEKTISVLSVNQANVKANFAAPVFKCINPESATKVEREFNEASWCIMKEKGVLPVRRVCFQGEPKQIDQGFSPWFCCLF